MDFVSIVHGCDSRKRLARQLCSNISEDEWAALEQGGFEGEINAFNRATLLRLNDDGYAQPNGSLCSAAADLADSADRIDSTQVERMVHMLKTFLDDCMADKPQAHRWIVFSCLALAFIFREPLHPVEVVHAETRVSDGEVIHYCPMREGDETLCGYCVCHPMAELLQAEADAVAQTRCIHGEKSADVQAILLRSGMTQSGVMPVRDVVFHEEVRDSCMGNLCGSYNSCWACPPAVGTLDECRKRCEAFDSIQVFAHAYMLEDAFDFEGMRGALADFKKRVAEMAPAVREKAGESLILSNEGCGQCSQCTWPDEPCRFPDKCFHSIEGYGLLVSELAAATGIAYYNGPGTVTFFGAVLYNGA